MLLNVLVGTALGVASYATEAETRIIVDRGTEQACHHFDQDLAVPVIGPARVEVWMRAEMRKAKGRKRVSVGVDGKPPEDYRVPLKWARKAAYNDGTGKLSRTLGPFAVAVPPGTHRLRIAVAKGNACVWFTGLTLRQGSLPEPVATPAMEPPKSSAVDISEGSEHAEQTPAEPVEEAVIEVPHDLPPDPYLLHAEALELELDGDPVAALAKLRQAAKLSTGDAMLAFDLARVAYDLGQPAPEDLAAFMTLPPATPDAHLLRAYIELGRGERSRTAESLAAVLEAQPGHAEAARLGRFLGPLPSESAPFKGFVRIGGQFDTNVTVPPDDVGSIIAGELPADTEIPELEKQSGGRSTTELLMRGGIGGSELGLYASAAPHVSNRDELKDFDAGVVSVFGTVRAGDDAKLVVSLASVRTRLFGNDFLRDAALAYQVEANSRLQWWVRVGARDFGFGNPESGAQGGHMDRDGPYGEVGTEYVLRAMAGVLRLGAGVHSQWTQGADQRMAGVRARVDQRWGSEPLAFSLGVDADGRSFWDSSSERSDLVLVPRASLAWSFTKAWRLAATYAYTDSRSRTAGGDVDYSYTRQVVSAALEVKW